MNGGRDEWSGRWLECVSVKGMEWLRDLQASAVGVAMRAPYPPGWIVNLPRLRPRWHQDLQLVDPNLIQTTIDVPAVNTRLPDDQAGASSGVCAEMKNLQNRDLG